MITVLTIGSTELGISKYGSPKAAQTASCTLILPGTGQPILGDSPCSAAAIIDNTASFVISLIIITSV
jgi:hypothetical protein